MSLDPKKKKHGCNDYSFLLHDCNSSIAYYPVLLHCTFVVGMGLIKLIIYIVI